MVFANISRMIGRILPRSDDDNFNHRQQEFDKKVGQNMKIKAESGHMVQSEGERLIADYLWENGIPYIYDALIQVRGGWIRPDFILPKHSNFIIEFKGMDTRDYNLMFEKKLQLLESAGLMTLIIKPEDLPNLDKLLS